MRVSRGVVPEVPAPCDRRPYGGAVEGDRRRGDHREGARSVEMEAMPDHVHLVVEVDPQYGVHKLVKAIKGRSSRVLRGEFPWLRSRLASL